MEQRSLAADHSLIEIARLRKSGGTFLGGESYLAQELAPGGLGGLLLFSRTHTVAKVLFSKPDESISLSAHMNISLVILSFEISAFSDGLLCNLVKNHMIDVLFYFTQIFSYLVSGVPQLSDVWN